jgi:hypothetical protein
MANLGVPVKLLHESLGHVITVELKTGEVSCSMDWSRSMKLIRITDVSGKVDGRLVDVQEGKSITDRTLASTLFPPYAHTHTLSHTIYKHITSYT